MKHSEMIGSGLQSTCVDFWPDLAKVEVAETKNVTKISMCASALFARYQQLYAWKFY